MKTLSKNEWIAVIISVFVVGFFFVFGQTLISIFNNETLNTGTVKVPEVLTQDILVGTGETAMTSDRVTVNYIGRFVNGDIFDSSVARNEPFQFVLGVGQVIEGWDRGIVGMRIGGKRMISIPPELGYGPNDYGPIPGGSTLIFEVELLKVER